MIWKVPASDYAAPAQLTSTITSPAGGLTVDGTALYGGAYTASNGGSVVRIDTGTGATSIAMLGDSSASMQPTSLIADTGRVYVAGGTGLAVDRKSTRLNSSHT